MGKSSDNKAGTASSAVIVVPREPYVRQRKEEQAVGPYCVDTRKDLEDRLPYQLLRPLSSSQDGPEPPSSVVVRDGSPLQKFETLENVEWKRLAEIWPGENAVIKREGEEELKLVCLKTPPPSPSLRLYEASAGLVSQLSSLGFCPSWCNHGLPWNGILESQGGGFCVPVFVDGSWRCLELDDMFPVDVNTKEPLFPYIHREDGVLEIWPSILFKAKLWLEGRYGPSSNSSCGLLWIFAWVPDPSEDANKALLHDDTFATSGIVWSDLVSPDQEDFKFQSWEHFHSDMEIAKEQKDEGWLESLKHAKLAVQEKYRKRMENDRAESIEVPDEPEGIFPINERAYVDAMEKFQAYRAQCKEKLLSVKPKALALHVNRLVRVYALTRKARTSEEADVTSLGDPHGQLWGREKVELVRGCIFIVSEYQPELVRLVGAVGVKGNVPNWSLEQTIWVRASVLDRLMNENALQALVWNIPHAMVGAEFTDIIDDHFRWHDENSWTRMCEPRVMTMVIQPNPETTLSKVLLFLTADCVAEETSFAKCRILDCHPTEWTSLEGNVMDAGDKGRRVWDLDDKAASLFIDDLVPGRPYPIIVSAPHGASLRAFCDTPISFMPVIDAWKSCFPSDVELFEASGDTGDVILCGTWCILARVRLQGKPSEPCRFAGQLMLSDAQLIPYVQILIVDNLTGQVSNPCLESNKIWIVPQVIKNDVDLIVVLSADTENDQALPPVHWSLKIVSKPGLSVFEQQDMNGAKEFRGRYLPNRNCILFRDKVKLPAPRSSFSMRLRLSNLENTCRVKLQILDQPEPGDDSLETKLNYSTISANQIALAEVEDDDLHWYPFHEHNRDHVIVQAILLNPSSKVGWSSEPYWETAQIPNDVLHGNDGGSENQVEWTLQTVSSDPGLELERHALWETSVKAVQRSWEVNSPGRAKIALATRLRALGFEEQAQALHPLSDGEMARRAVQHKARALSTGMGKHKEDPEMFIPRCPKPGSDEEEYFLDMFARSDPVVFDQEEALRNDREEKLRFIAEHFLF